MPDVTADPTTGEGTVPAETNRRTGPRLGATLLLLCLAMSAVVASIVSFALYRPIPASLAVAEEPTEVTLIAEEMTDTRSVDLSATLGEDTSINSPATGILTSTACGAGTAIRSGTSTFVVDRTLLVNLRTETPLWRDLAFDNSGTDVAALQRELSRLGYEVTETGRFDWQTWTAWDALVESLGGDTVYGELSLAQVLWLPAIEIMSDTCAIRLGQSVAQGEALVTLANPLLRAAVKSYPADLVPGERKLIVGATDIPIDESGQITSDGLAALAETDEFKRYAQSPDDSSLQADLVLVSSVTVYPVPPAAVAMTGENTGCVLFSASEADASAEDSIPVTVVASKLGRSYITFEQTPTSEAIAARAPRGSSCS
ncbi:peptidoglycan-binding domain-containing protein [Gulosibacter molinativorax]|uniref:Peptidoglycan-binding protein n=1 Tax=Gulosibacter molinativorax TaxID=256821 RepID=A0ABT7C4Y7_9MICO|nr:peptidoglycan-binding domain-containing protein [Gulosibacter molinativorax]MDJ1370255.1 peptidoglycan-binding protein [Gulosibacter molinativorax]QUY61671.1 Hypotetical protein [Gulosibacter molinativorax]